MTQTVVEPPAQRAEQPLGLFTQIREDWLAHGRDWTRPGFRAIAVHRFGNWRMRIGNKAIRAPFSMIYRMMFRRVRNHYGIELPYSAFVGRRVVIEHQGALVIHGNSRIGDESIIRQGVTLGNKTLDRPMDAPTLGSRVNVGAGAKILGAVTIGDGASIGANAVVLSDVPAGAIAVGIPAKVLGKRQCCMIGVVAIGRNEGERLRVCLASALRDSKQVAYVDSGSSDGSVAMARQMGAQVVELDLKIPFTAARARNAGFEKLMTFAPETEFVQFVDGDCEIVEGWIPHALETFSREPRAGVVCGRRRERFPNASIYNTLCDIEWNTPIGKARSCGGDALIRVNAFREVKGYNSDIIAGEEPEMCVRLRAAGWDIWRIDAEMTLHDAAMTKFSQWWKRTLRSGHAFAEGFAMHGAPPESHNARQTRSIWIWGLVIPVVIAAATIVLAFIAPRWCWIPSIGFLLFPVLALKIAMTKQRAGLSVRDSLLYAFFVVLGKFPQLLGMLKYRSSRARGRRSSLIEYKSTGVATSATK